MTENKIIEALECCSSHDWQCDENCPFFSCCSKYLMSSESLNIINRQKKDIERLNNYKELYEDLKEENLETIRCIKQSIKSARAEAVREFAEKLKSTMTINNTNGDYLDYAIYYSCLMEDIDNLVEEMMEEKGNA